MGKIFFISFFQSQLDGLSLYKPFNRNSCFLNGCGQIDDGSELLGDQTIFSDGEKAANGFEALAS